jgi:6-phosphogluconate dehydrogenase
VVVDGNHSFGGGFAGRFVAKFICLIKVYPRMNTKVFMVMGVSGSGKTTVGSLLAFRLGISFVDGDDFHSAANIEKMSRGIPLDDDDRLDWLKAINRKALEVLLDGQSVVIACSALKATYRELLAQNIEASVVWICLHGSASLILQRMEQRATHYMPASLLPSQLHTLELPEDGLLIDISKDAAAIVQYIMEETSKPELGIVGLGVMGASLARNWARAGIPLALYNRYLPGKEEQIAEKAIQTYTELGTALGFEDLPSFVLAIQRPRKIFMMIKAGAETDAFIKEILPLLEPGDILIDGGNSHFEDTQRRMMALEERHIFLVGAGISGGEQGALYGPSIMTSGSKVAYKKLEKLFWAIAAKDKQGNPCCTYIGPQGSGHYVKMIHNGMEYAEMQLIAETYAYLRYVNGMDVAQIAELFAAWHDGPLHSFLLEITIPILKKKEGDQYLIDLILDVAGNKGTGHWATMAASAIGFPAGMITSALFARYLSTLKQTVTGLRRNHAALAHAAPALDVANIKDAYTAARLVNHQQGFLLMHTAATQYSWSLNLSEIARLWTSGCIIRSALMEQLVIHLKEQNDLFDCTSIQKEVEILKPALKAFCICAIQSDLSLPCHLAALDYLNGLLAQYPTANIIQAQRDFFGAHTYQKRGDVTGAYYHTQW